jgi:predicted transport protein
MDTLGIDHNSSPVIIEYKRGQNDSVINQGLSYLLWLLDHKDTFKEIAYRVRSITAIDWASPRVICVAESYNKFDLDTVDLLPIDIELLRYRIYENNLLLVEPEIQRKVKISTSEIFDKAEGQKRELKEHEKHTVEDHLKSTSDHTRELFVALKEKIMALDDSIIEDPKAKYIAYKLTNNFVDVTDPTGIARDLTKPKPVGHWGNGDYEVKLDRSEDVDAVMALINQSYSYNR